MADYSFVKDSNGNVCGIWIKDTSALDKPGMIEALLVQRAPHLLNDYLVKKYRKVSNNQDSAGGCFVMFGSTKAPGEPTPKPIVSDVNDSYAASNNNKIIVEKKLSNDLVLSILIILFILCGFYAIYDIFLKK